MGVGLEELKEARFSPLFYAGKNYKKLYVFSNDKGTLLLKKKYFYFDHDTLPLKCVIVYLARDILAFVMYCVNGESGSSQLIESTDSMILFLLLLLLSSVDLAR